MGWIREEYRLPHDHGWTATPGHKILVLDRGAVLLEFPAEWTLEPASEGGQINVRDGVTTEDSRCVLAVSCLPIPPIDWTELPLAKLLIDVVDDGERDLISVGPVRETSRDGLGLAWCELRVVDPGEHRECRSRVCLARGNGVQCLITFDFWPEDELRLNPVWHHVLGSLRLGRKLDEPTRGRRIV